MVNSIHSIRSTVRPAPRSPLRPWLVAVTVLGWLSTVASFYFYDLARPERWGSDRFWGARQGIRFEKAYLEVGFWIAVAAVVLGLLSSIIESVVRRQERRGVALSVVFLVLGSVVALMLSAIAL